MKKNIGASLIPAPALTAKSKRMKLYLCEGYDPLFGPIRDLVYAASITEAKAKFLTFFGILSLHTQIQKL